MVSKPIVLILGAGASMPYGLPSGAGLVNLIAYPDESNLSKNIFIDRNNFLELLNKGVIDLHSGTPYKLGGINSAHLELQNDLRKLSASISLDYFLKNNPYYLDIGKILIAFTIYYLENEKEIFSPQNNNLNWYSHLWNQIKAPTFEQFIRQPLRIYTFNYDLTLDYFLYHQIRNYYNSYDPSKKPIHSVDLDLVKDLMPKHIYGSRKINLASGNCFNNFETLGANFADESKQGKFAFDLLDEIHLIDESETKHIFNEIGDTVNAYKQVFFMGFGFDEANLQNFDVRYWRRNNFTIKGTIKGYSKAEKRDLAKRFFDDPQAMPDNIDALQNPYFIDTDCNNFIRSDGFLL